MTGALKPPQRTIAPADIMAQARANCAERLRAAGHAAEADAFARGDRDEAWAMVHEVNKLRTEASTSAYAMAGPASHRDHGQPNAAPAGRSAGRRAPSTFAIIANQSEATMNPCELTPRQTAVLELMSKGLPNKQIARESPFDQAPAELKPTLMAMATLEQRVKEARQE